MEVIDLQNQLTNLQFRGVGLNLDEKMQLEMALQVLHNEVGSDEVLFWGKINGVKNDYYLALAVTYEGYFEFPLKKFYWCLSNDFTFRETPDLNDQHKEFIDRDHTFFTGEPNRKLISTQAEGEEEAQEPPEEEEEGQKEPDSEVSEKEEVQVPPKDLTELDRLKYVVQAIENDCQIAPAGAFKMTSLHQVRRNEAFKGLTSKTSTALNSYVHFRNVQTEAKKKALDDSSAPFNPNFLESISAD